MPVGCLHTIGSPHTKVATLQKITHVCFFAKHSPFHSSIMIGAYLEVAKIPKSVLLDIICIIRVGSSSASL